MVSKFLEETIGMVEIPELHLESGRVLKKVRQAYVVYGSLDARGVILVCHALTGSHHVAGPDVPDCLRRGGILCWLRKPSIRRGSAFFASTSWGAPTGALRP